MRKETVYLTTGMLLENTNGIYQITGFNEKNGTFCTVREVIYDDDEDLDKFSLGQELYLTKSEVEECLHHMTGRNIEAAAIMPG